jgi:hypothetical protein
MDERERKGLAEREGFSARLVNTEQFACSSMSSSQLLWFCHQYWHTQEVHFSANC